MPAHRGGLGRFGQENPPGGHAGEVAAFQSPAHPTIEPRGSAEVSGAADDGVGRRRPAPSCRPG